MTAPLAAHRRLSLFLILYGALLLALLPKLSLWLDEVVDMMGTSRSLPDAIRWASTNPGGVPLGYIVHWASIQLFGVSAFAARLPSAAASIIGCIGIYLLARSWPMKYPLLPAIVFAAFPLQWRYAMEARAYEMALCISIWTIFLFQSLVHRPAGWKFALYGLVAIAGMYTQPLFLFVLAAQALWVLCNKRSILPGVVLTLAVVGLTFGGWYIYAAGWSHPLTGVEGSQAIGWSSLGLVAHEVTGMGYPGVLLMLLSIAAGIRHARPRPSDLPLWLLYIALPIVGVLIVDLAFGYFLAIRQMIFVLTPLAMLFSWGVESLAAAHRKLALALVVAFFAGALYQDIEIFFRPRENWQAAATNLDAEVNKGACIIFEPADFEAYYTFFSPQLSSSKCPAGKVTDYSHVAIAVSPRHDEAALSRWEAELTEIGLKRRRILGPVLPDVEVFTKTPLY